LGYVPQRSGGKWVARFYLGRDTTHVYRGKVTSRHYEKKVIGQADDYSDADNLTTLSFDQAQAKARRMHSERAHAEAGIPCGPYTVARAIDDYITYMKASSRSTTKDTETRAKAFILPTLGHVLVSDLTSERLRKFLSDLAATPARVRFARGAPIAHRSDYNERARKCSANRLFAILRAALNHAFAEGKVASDAAWGKRVKPFRGVYGKRDRILSIDEARRLINACPADFRDLVQAALMTGCRFGELTRLVASDFKHGTIHVKRSKSGKERYIHLTDEGRDLFAQLCIGKAGDVVLFPCTQSQQRNAFTTALDAAAITPPITFHGLRHTYASHAVMNGVPLMVVAETLGHADTRMVEKNYGHLAPSYLRDAIRAGAPTFGTVEATNVRSIVHHE
jgi:integrase